MNSRTGRLFDENARGSPRVVAVLALELHEAADRQPVERVEGLALRAQDLGARREADPELEDADAGEPRGDEVAELVDHHERAEDGEEQDDRDDRLQELGHAEPPIVPARERRPDLGIEGDQRVDVGLAGSGTEALDGRLEQPRDAEEVERPLEEPRHRDVVGGDQRGRCPWARDPRLASDAQRREPPDIRLAEIEARRGDEVGRRGRRGAAVRDRSWRTGSGVAYRGCPSGP